MAKASKDQKNQKDQGEGEATESPRSKAALQGKRMNMFGMNPNDVVIIGLDTPHKAGEHPLYDERINDPLDEAMIRNVQKYGIIEPVVVRKDGDTPLVVDGRQRIRWAREALKRQVEEGSLQISVPVIVKYGDDITMMGIMISANEIRRNDGMLVRAQKLGRMLDMGMNDTDAALVFGVSKTAIRNWKKLLDCDAEVLGAIDTGELPASAAADLAALPREEQVKELEKLRSEAEAQGSAKITTEQTTRIRRSRTTNEGDGVARKAPRKPVLKAIVKASSSALPTEVIAAIKWVLGESDGLDIPGLAEALESMKLANKLKGLKISAAQQEIINQLKDGPVPVSELNKKTLAALGKRQICEEITAEDGTECIQLTASFLETLASMTGDEEEDADDGSAEGSDEDGEDNDADSDAGEDSDSEDLTLPPEPEEQLVGATA